MKQGNIQNWPDIKSCKNLLLFVELVDELLFDYSIPSNRIATLNSHYLCLDAISAIESIEKAKVPEGTLKPIMAELYTSLSKDVLFKRKGEDPLKYFVKYHPKVGYQIISDPDNFNYEEEKKVINTLRQRYFRDNWYIDSQKEEIIRLVIENRQEDWLDLFRITKSFLTELINAGYSARFILLELHRFFYQNKTISTPDVISNFLEIFDSKERKYNVIAVMNSTLSKSLIESDDVKVKDYYSPHTKSKKEQAFLYKKPGERYILLNEEAVDPIIAVEECKHRIDLLMSMRRMVDHDIDYNPNMIRWGVYQSNKDFFLVKKEKSAVKRVKMPSKSQMFFQFRNLFNAVDNTLKHNNDRDIFAVVNALRFHALSLDSNAKENQLLDLWAIFETILDIQNNHTSDRIQQVCIYLIPILKRKYIYSLFFQLSFDIKNYSSKWYTQIVGDAKDTDEIVYRTSAFVLLPKYEALRNDFLIACDDFPLLQERINYYMKKLSSPHAIFDFIDKHSERVCWQIMRIYRNRNLIIHNAASMPYLSLLVENLHNYVDDFLEYAIQSLAQSHSLASMCQELFAQECEFIDYFKRSKEKEVSEETIRRMLI